MTIVFISRELSNFSSKEARVRCNVSQRLGEKRRRKRRRRKKRRKKRKREMDRMEGERLQGDKWMQRRLNKDQAKN